MQSPSWLPSLVWTDYRLAVLVTVIVPLVLLIWSVVQKSEPIQHLMVIYWRVASLLAITVYLMIAVIPASFITGWLARILIPVSLWFWADLNEEIAELSATRLKLAFTSWRWAISFYGLIGAIVQLPALRCALLPSDVLVKNPFCRVWLEPTWLFREFFHPNTRPYFLGFLALVGLAIYVLYLGYFVFVRWGKQGRSATGQ